jgi:hypothetical protein
MIFPTNTLCPLRAFTPAHADNALTVAVVADPLTASGFRGVRIATWEYTGKTVVGGDAADRKLLSMVKARQDVWAGAADLPVAACGVREMQHGGAACNHCSAHHDSPGLGGSCQPRVPRLLPVRGWCGHGGNRAVAS